MAIIQESQKSQKENTNRRKRESVMTKNAWFRLCNDVVSVSEGERAGKKHLMKFALKGFYNEF